MAAGRLSPWRQAAFASGAAHYSAMDVALRHSLLYAFTLVVPTLPHANCRFLLWLGSQHMHSISRPPAAGGHFCRPPPHATPSHTGHAFTVLQHTEHHCRLAENVPARHTDHRPGAVSAEQEAAHALQSQESISFETSNPKSEECQTGSAGLRIACPHTTRDR